MAAFRKLFLALAVVTLFATAASAQTTAALQCVANAGVPPTIRAEGLTELVGDVTLNCTGGIPTQFSAVVPASNVTIFLNTNVTSRLLASGNWSEAFLLIDEPIRRRIRLCLCSHAATPPRMKSRRLPVPASFTERALVSACTAAPRVAAPPTSTAIS